MKIQDIIGKIKEYQLHIPVFQREYVWKRNDVKELFRSLLKDYPTGTMLTWETRNPPMLKGDHKYHENQGAIKLLLDGQQRITTLYMIITGEIPQYYTTKDIIQDTRGLYVNLKTLELEYYIKNKMENNLLWINLTDIFQNKINIFSLIKEEGKKNPDLSEEEENQINNNYTKIRNLLEKEFLEQTIPVSATINEAIDIFYIVNASGVSLTDAELALAQISGYWPEARGLFKKKLEELEEHGWVFSLDFIVYVLLGILYSIGHDMTKLHNNKNKEQLQKVWNILSTKVLDYVCSIMRTHAFVDHTKEINSIYALVPIIVYVFHKEDNALSAIEIKKITKRFYYSQIRSRYVSQLGQKLTKDLGIIKELENPFDELLNIIKEEKELTIDPNEFIGASVQTPLFSLMKWYFKSQGAVCLSSNVSLRKNMGKVYSLENDHIFPFSLLKQKGYDRRNKHKYGLAQEITNRAILSQVANRTKSNIDTNIYLQKIFEENPQALELQKIPTDKKFRDIDNYEGFLIERRKKLADGLNHFLENIVSTEESHLALDIEDIIAEGESKYLEFKSSLRWSMKEQKEDKILEQVVLKVISSFANSEGGTLLIGVNDSGEVLGLQEDYSLLKGDKDEFELHLSNIISRSFGKTFLTRYLDISFPVLGEQEICMIKIEPSKDAVYFNVIDKNGQKKETMYIRTGNSSSEFFSLKDMENYIKQRF